MERSYALFDTVSRYPIEECGEGFASIAQAATRAGIEMTFSETTLAGRFDRIFHIRRSLIEPLVAIGREMNDRGWVLKIEEGFRTRQMQAALACEPAVFDRIVRTCVWECNGQRPPIELVQRRAMCLIAHLPRTGTHLCGAAVDISLFRRDDGSEVRRGGHYLDMDERTPMASQFIEDEHVRNRQVITTVMESHGFTHYPGEFWHYNSGDALDQMLRNTTRPGRFGPVEWDPATNRVTPFTDPDSPLVDRDTIAVQLERALQRLETGSFTER